jgi:triphosphoribosyl-dephospho-CoA synthase
MHTDAARADRARRFCWACGLDVEVRKAGNVSLASPGHGMSAGLFIESARAAAGPLCEAGAPVGQRIERAVHATLAVAKCNTNLGILLLSAPILTAAQARNGGAWSEDELRHAVQQVLLQLDVNDAAAAYRAIAAAQPGGLGQADEADVHRVPHIDLRAAMALAADRDQIAQAYAQGFSHVFDELLPAFCRAHDGVWTPRAGMLRAYLNLLATQPDSHIVRKHGEALAHSVMNEARPWARRADAGEALETDPGYVAWDTSLKARAINPGTSADLVVATALLASFSFAPATAEAIQAPD